VLGPRALGRALLARQSLLERRSAAALDMVEHLVGLQAQAPLAPYVGLWSRLVDFDPAELSNAILERRAVRTSLMRATIHLVSARDALWLWPLIEPVLGRGFRASSFGRAAEGIEIEAVLAAGRELLDARPHSSTQLASSLRSRWPDVPADALSYAVGYLVPLVHVPPRGVWGTSGPVARTTMEGWLGRPLERDGSIDDLVLRYLAAFGPATTMDVQAWSGLTRLRVVLERLRPRLRTFRDERGRELFDIPDAPRPDPATPAPPRFLPEYDNVLLGHADRTRIIPAGRRIPLPPGNGATTGTILLDGKYAGTWRIARSSLPPRLTIEPFEPIAAAERTALEDEAARLLSFAGVSGGEIVVRPSTS